MKKKVEYIVVREMCDTQDSVRYYKKEDTFKDLKTARNYLKDLIEALKTINPYIGSRNKVEAVSKCLNKYGLSGAYETEGINNQIEKRIIIEKSTILVGI